MPQSLSFPLSATATRAVSTFRALLRPLLYAGVPASLDRGQQRELVTFVVLLSILVTIPDIFTFRSFHCVAGDCAALYAGIATANT